MFLTAEQPPGLQNVFEYFKTLSLAQRDCMSELVILLKLILAIPATNAISVRSASTVCRLKSYLRSTVSNSFNNLLILHTHKQRTDELNLAVCLNDFVSENKQVCII